MSYFINYQNKMNPNYQKIYFDRDNTPITADEICQECAGKNIISPMKFMYLNLDEGIYKCSAADCMYPFRNFIFKEMKTNRMYKYKFGQKSTVIFTPAQDVHVFQNSIPKIPEPSTSSNQTTKMELIKCLKSREKITPAKLSKFHDVNQLLDVFNKSAKNPSTDSVQINKVSVTSPLTLIQHLNRTKVKLTPVVETIQWNSL